MSRTAKIRALAMRDPQAASAELCVLLAGLFGLDAREVRINSDIYSLNSLNGFFKAGGQRFFFKFHQEEGEEAGRGEYYRAGILAEAGLPVDLPVYKASEPGEQILVYQRREDRRFADLLVGLDKRDDPNLRQRAIIAEERLTDRLLATYLKTLHPITSAEAGAEPVHRLFHDRLVNAPGDHAPGGRLKRFYLGQTFAFPGVTLDWETFSSLRFVINGRAYERTIGELFDAALDLLRPERMVGAGGVVAHGDAHNANVWFVEKGDTDELVLFDPAFAGWHVPTLLAEIKPTFHNVFAHPFWLYSPESATKAFSARAERRGDALHISMNWTLSPVRRELLTVKAERLWRPLLAELRRREMLPSDWRQQMRLALFLCPTLVMNLRAGEGSHTPVSSLIGWAVSMMAGSEPVDRCDLVTDFFAAIDPGKNAVVSA